MIGLILLLITDVTLEFCSWHLPFYSKNYCTKFAHLTHTYTCMYTHNRSAVSIYWTGLLD